MSYSRAQAEAGPLTRDRIRAVIARSRRVCFTQLALFAALVAGFGSLALQLEGGARAAAGGCTALSLWGVLGAGLSTWDHFRASIVLKRLSAQEIAAETDARAFWWKYRAVFPLSWEDK